MVILRDQTEEFHHVSNYTAVRDSLKVGYARPKSGTEVGDRNVNKENREYQVKEDNRNIRESVRKNRKETDDPVGSEVNPNMSEMGRSVRGGDEASEGHGGSRDEP